MDLLITYNPGLLFKLLLVAEGASVGTLWECSRDKPLPSSFNPSALAHNIRAKRSVRYIMNYWALSFDTYVLIVTATSFAFVFVLLKMQFFRFPC